MLLQSATELKGEQSLFVTPPGVSAVMGEMFVNRATVLDAMSAAVLCATRVMPEDVQESFRRLMASETDAGAKANLEMTMRDCVAMNPHGELLLCPDTGAPTFHVRIGEDVRVEGGFSTFKSMSKKALADATARGMLRPNLVHPITRANSGDNTGRFMPQVELYFDPSISHIEIMAVPISGGSETSGTFFRMMSPVDGMQGILKFVLDCVRVSTYAGKTCPPNVIGIGIGGTSDMCMKLAKQAAVLRPIGTSHPDPDMARLEEEILSLVNSLGIGPLGRGGCASAHAVHVEYAACHISGLPVAYNAQCLLGRRGLVRIETDGTLNTVKTMDWEIRE